MGFQSFHSARVILDALVPAVYVLAEVGILWGDESISLEVGDAAIVDFARRASAHEAAEQMQPNQKRRIEIALITILVLALALTRVFILIV